MSSYVDHGHRHLPGGTDPIPGLSSSGGEGLQFNSGAYGPDNVGDWLLIDADDFVGSAFGNASQVDPTSYSVALGTKYGTLLALSDDAPFYAWAAAIKVDHSGTPALTANGLDIDLLSGGTSEAHGIRMSVDATDGSGQAIGESVGVYSETGGALGIDLTALNFGTASVEAIGIQSFAHHDGGGAGSPGHGGKLIGQAVGNHAQSIGVGILAQGITDFDTGGKAYGLIAQAFPGQSSGYPTPAHGIAIEARDHGGNPIFQVRDDGSVHIKTSTSVIADL